MKHVGKMKNNSARVAVAYRTIPGDHNSALVVGTSGLTDSYHDSLMSLIESESGQQANELADMLAVRRFPDGSVMLQYLHSTGHLKKVPTSLVLMTPNAQTSIPLNEVNQMIADQKGVKLEDLAISDGAEKPVKKESAREEVISTEIIVPEVRAVAEVDDEVSDPTLVAKSYRSKADKLSKDAANFRRMADAIDPPKAKAKKVEVTVD
jgi:hypothetical protein